MPEPSRIWVGGLPSDIAELELYEEFSRHGSVSSVAIRSSTRDTFAFVEMDPRGAEAAVRAMNGSPLWGSAHLNVRIANDTQIRRPVSGPPDRRPYSLEGDRGGRSPARVESASGQLLSIDGDEDWDPLDIWRDCLGRKRSHQPSPREDDRPRHQLVPRPGYRGDHVEPQHWGSGRERSPRRDEPHSPLHQSRQGSPRRRGGSPPRRGPPSLLPPPPTGSVEHARFDEGALEWRARHLSITVENIPWDLGWMELKNLGRTYGFVAHARTYAEGSTHFGVLEFSNREVADRAKEGLDGQFISGAKRSLVVRVGAPPELLKTGGGKR